MAAAAALPVRSPQDPHMAHTAAPQSLLDVPCNSTTIVGELAHRPIRALESMEVTLCIPRCKCGRQCSHNVGQPTNFGPWGNFGRDEHDLVSARRRKTGALTAS